MECTLSLKTYQLGISSSQHEKNLFFSKHKLEYMNLHHVLTSTRRFRADETFFLVSQRLFQPIEFSRSKFDRLDPSYQTSKARIRQVGKDSAFLLASSCLSPKAFVLAHFTRQNTFFSKKEKRSKSTRQTHFFKMSQNSFI